ncbi:MAG: hypothetical protein ABFD00_10480 [Chloroherpetonaceae bacterium]
MIPHKKELLKFMHAAGFDWICDIAYVNGIEMVGSKMNDCDKLWWRSLEVEGSGFIQLFKGTIKNLYKEKSES